MTHVHIDTLHLRVKGMSRRQARQLVRGLGPRLLAALAGEGPGRASGAHVRLDAVDAGTVTGTAGTLPQHAAETTARAIQNEIDR